MLMQTLRIMHRTPLVLATALLTSVSAFAQTEINDEARLKAIANDLNGSYVLTQNITLLLMGPPFKNIAFTSAVVKGYKQAANPGPLGFAAWLVQELFVAQVF